MGQPDWDPDQVPPPWSDARVRVSSSATVGLIGRAEASNGILTVASPPTVGTRLTAALPIDAMTDPTRGDAG
ncbi:MAG TPA: hypothetical protein VJ649_06990 [Actinomycetes bacterium]|nr:hypothetical protein [Actinomycetes bacterium]